MVINISNSRKRSLYQWRYRDPVRCYLDAGCKARSDRWYRGSCPWLVLQCRYSELSPCTSAGYTETARNQPRSTSTHSQHHNVQITSHDLLQSHKVISKSKQQGLLPVSHATCYCYSYCTTRSSAVAVIADRIGELSNQFRLRPIRTAGTQSDSSG